MNVLIVYAHHEAQSFNAALLARSVEVLTARGHEVRISDLYAMRFDPVATADDFLASGGFPTGCNMIASRNTTTSAAR